MPVRLCGGSDVALTATASVSSLLESSVPLDLDARDDDRLDRTVAAPVGVLPIASTTSRLAWSATSPKIVCLPFSHGVGPTVTKNCDPLVPGAGVGHREQVRLVEDQLGVGLVLERVARAAGAGAERAAALDHEAADDPVEAETVVERAGLPTGLGSFHGLVPSASPTKFSTVFGAWFGKRLISSRRGWSRASHRGCRPPVTFRQTPQCEQHGAGNADLAATSHDGSAGHASILARRPTAPARVDGVHPLEGCDLRCVDIGVARR